MVLLSITESAKLIVPDVSSKLILVSFVIASLFSIVTIWLFSSSVAISIATCSSTSTVTSEVLSPSAFISL